MLVVFYLPWISLYCYSSFGRTFSFEIFSRQKVREVPPTETVVRLAELVLTLNTFEFNDKFYTQTRGVAMGTKMGPSFANIFLGYIEKKFLRRTLV